MLFKKRISNIGAQIAALGAPLRLALIVITFGAAGLILFWIFDRIFYYYLAQDYAKEIADAYDLNTGLTTALIWASFALILFFARYVFSLSGEKRLIGGLGLLTLLIGHSLAIGRLDNNFRRGGQAERCYVLMRDSVKILNRVGADPQSGRECRPLTPEMAEKIELYKQGNRPNEITSDDGPFFSPISGEPVAWYTRNETGSIELFDLMGFHPRTGVELLPVDRQVVDAWKNQNAKKVKRSPIRVSPDNYSFFDPVTGAAQVWFWRDESENYEFYDGPGFQPRTGEALQLITKDVIGQWREALRAAATKKRLEQEELAKEERDRADRERMAQQVEADALRHQERAAKDCDFLAANPTDARKTADGVSFDILKQQADQAYQACDEAVQFFPNELRYKYQLGRAAQFKDKKKAFELFTLLTSMKYPAAFDNLGGMYLERKDIDAAIRIFKSGASLGDADSMVSLAELADRGYYGRPDPAATKWALLSKAAELGHAGAQKAVAEENARREAAALQQAREQEAARNAAAIFGTILQGVGRH